jgi:hypothetical protein
LHVPENSSQQLNIAIFFALIAYKNSNSTQSNEFETICTSQVSEKRTTEPKTVASGVEKSLLAHEMAEAIVSNNNCE